MGSSGDIAGDCASLNAGNQCAIDACTVETTFVDRWFTVMFSQGGFESYVDFNADFQHISQGGTFDPETNCPGIPNPVGSDKECCGDHALLTRHPYRLYSGFTTRSCCGGEVINNELNQCCNSAVIDISDICNESCNGDHCCGSIAYDPLILECCSDNSLAPITAC